MSTANGRPLPPPAPSQRAKQDQDSGDRHSTGVRPRAASNPLISDAPEPPSVESPAELPLAEGIQNNSIAPESLRKPYASLSPGPKKKDPSRSATPAKRSDTSPRPKLESVPLWDEPSSLTSAGTKSTRAICKKHKIARGKNGECLMCRKEERAASSGLGWKLMVALVFFAVVVGGIIAAMVRMPA